MNFLNTKKHTELCFYPQWKLVSSTCSKGRLRAELLSKPRSELRATEWEGWVERHSNLLFERHDKDSSHFQQVLHVVFVFLLYPSATVHTVVLRTVRRNLQAVAGNKRWLTEFKPERGAEGTLQFTNYYHGSEKQDNGKCLREDSLGGFLLQSPCIQDNISTDHSYKSPNHRTMKWEITDEKLQRFTCSSSSSL